MPEHLVARQTAERREIWVQLAAVCTSIVALVIAASLVTRINEIRKERQLVINPEDIKGLPPDISLLGKLGTFRALAIDWAFIRADRMKEEGKHYEAYLLHETICKLAPRFAKVWVHASWNMAYNISVTQYTPEARWQWVNNGIKVLRDQGLLYNPKSVSLYKELSWIYWHKIGDFLDDEHLNYKKALAVEMEALLGAPPITLSDEEYFAWFKRIVDAPHNVEEFIEKDAEVAQLVGKLGGMGLRPDRTFLEFVARNLRPELKPKDLTAQSPVDDSLFDRQMRLLRDPANAAPLERLLSALRSRALRDDYHLNVDFMYKLMVEQYGPLDWRSAFAHSLYWSALGDEETRGHINLDIGDKLNNARFVFFGLQNLIMRGRIVLIPNFDDPFSSYIEFLPDSRLIPYLHDTYMRLGKEHFGDDPRFIEGTPGPNYFNGFVSAMHNWIEILYLEGGAKNQKLAEVYYAWLRENNPHPDGSTQETYMLTLDEFVMRDVLAQMSTYRTATAILRGLVDRSLKQFALGNYDAGVSTLVRARFCYDFWMIDTRIDTNERRKMQPFHLVVRDQLDGFMRRAEVDALWKARLWKNLTESREDMVRLLTQGVYDRLAPYFAELSAAQTPPWAVERAFPEPFGMEEYRKSAPPEVIGAPRRDDVEQGTKDNR